MAVALRGKYERKMFWASEFKPLDHEKRAKELEKKRVVDAARNHFNGSTPHFDSLLSALYDKGFLKLPEQSK